MPESVCSKPCGARQATVRRELSCCWDCNACRPDEIIVNGTSCVSCPPNTWPDDFTATVCLPIPPDVFSAGPVAKALVAIATGVLVAITTVGALFIRHRRTRIIKATSLTHSMLMLAATALACVGVYVTCSSPASDVICVISDAIFHMSICLLFAPLLVKNIRVYRIFAAGKKGLVHPRFVSGKLQIVFIAVPVLIEVECDFLTIFTINIKSLFRCVLISFLLRCFLFVCKYITSYCHATLLVIIVWNLTAVIINYRL